MVGKYTLIPVIPKHYVHIVIQSVFLLHFFNFKVYTFYWVSAWNQTKHLTVVGADLKKC